MKVRRRPWGLVVVVLVVAGLCVWLALRHRAHEMSSDSPSVPVSAATARRADVPVAIEAIGAAQAWQSDTIHAQITGRLLRVPVAEGTEVKTGEVIAQIDPAPFRAALLQAQGALERDQAQLGLARLDLKRDQSLLLEDSIASQQVDEQQAMVKELEGTVLTDQGAVDSARVNLAYCTITSPVSGRVGVRLVDAGNLVSPTDATGIITVNQIEPIAVAFSVPEGDFQRLRQASDMFSRPLETQAYSQDTGALLGRGILRIADNHVDPGSGSVALKARFANTGRLLWPGQFVNVRLTLNVLQDVVTIPNAAVNEGPGQPYAYVIGADHHVSVRPIKVTLVQDATAVIGSGLQPGEAVVTDGQMDLKPGSPVAVRAQPPTSGALEPAAAQ
ncbi:MAG: efflux RND transporter periplasmic adaptor subunit [Steroidobacteraceae bacterium]